MCSKGALQSSIALTSKCSKTLIWHSMQESGDGCQPWRKPWSQQKYTLNCLQAPWCSPTMMSNQNAYDEDEQSSSPTTYHCKGLPRACLPISKDADIIPIQDRTNQRLCVHEDFLCKPKSNQKKLVTKIGSSLNKTFLSTAGNVMMTTGKHKVWHPSVLQQEHFFPLGSGSIFLKAGKFLLHLVKLWYQRPC